VDETAEGGLLSQFQLFSTPARARAAETLKLERTPSDLADQAYALTPAEIALMWQTAPPRMPIPPPAG
jgi:aryl-alcohol dehydrogenase-like predicted oxidoreductase